MSLFPAYSSNVVTGSSKDGGSIDWLSNSSFQTEIPSEKPIIDISSNSSSDEYENSLEISYRNEDRFLYKETFDGVKERKKERIEYTKKDKKERKKYGKKSLKAQFERVLENVYFEDKHRDRGNNNVNTLCSRARPFYNIEKKSLGFVLYKKVKKDMSQRYYAKNIDALNKTKKKDTIIKKESVKNTNKDKNYILQSSVKLEEEQTSKTREYNEKLTKNPNDVELWLRYIDFQDTLTEYQTHQFLEDTQRSTTLRKFSIVEKALEKNVNCTELLKLKLRFMAELMPADRFSNELEVLVNKDSGNIVLWENFIMAVQGSLAMCTVPKVLDLYTKCFCILRQKSRTNSRIYDEKLLEMLYQCLIFLRHAGLWEQMWETIRLNLSLNLNLSRGSLYFQKIIDEKKLIGMEEVILMSRLPLNQLWLRTESLRENCHWISVSRDELELVGDSRRFVLPEDVADFVHPIVTPNSNFRMSIYCLLSLKVPLLPTRDFMLKEFALKEFVWGTDSSEILFPFAYPVVGEMAGHKQRKALLQGILDGHLTSGPQYLKFHPAQEPYLDFIREIFSTIAENLPSLQRTSIYIWWLRFERLLVFLNKDDPLKYDNKRKKLRTTLKEFLKKDENRNNLHFYKEYALIEREMGKFDSCVNILETAIQLQGTCPSSISNIEERAALFNLYKTFFETLLNTETYKDTHRERILKIVKQMVPETSEDRLSSVEKYLQDYVNNLLQAQSLEDDTNTFFLPRLECDVIICYVYFLYVKDYNICKVISVLRDCIEHYEQLPHFQEILRESEVAIVQLHYERTQETSALLKESVNNILHVHPNNFYALSVSACMKSELPSWKFNTRSTNIDVWRAISTCLAARKRIYFLKQLGHDDAANAVLNKLVSFHQMIGRLPQTRCCPLLWRMYMLLLRENNLCEKKGEAVYHESVASCPWARSIHIDAAEVAPQFLTQIQDVIREKELRMHVTPEELNILRGEN